MCKKSMGSVNQYKLTGLIAGTLGFGGETCALAFEIRKLAFDHLQHAPSVPAIKLISGTAMLECQNPIESSLCIGRAPIPLSSLSVYSLAEHPAAYPTARTIWGLGLSQTKPRPKTLNP